ncbi:LysR family transcriptional regulator [Ralstonia pseudosolanacearum]|uniref:LysR family transcriptional regulator n=1 Tax=Ralstonia pseudosolanacearum TaxID=1310165 RepID=UPI00386820B7
MNMLVRGTLEGVPVFVEAVDAGGFARAAERLSLSRSAVGKAIARLEGRLGVRLFHRTTSSMNLTEEGQIYYERCLRALAELRDGEALLETGRREMSGRLKITMPLLFGRFCVEPILLDLAQEYPALELDLRFSDSIIDLIGERFDLAIRNHALGDTRGLNYRKIASQNKVICASPNYLAKRGMPTDIDQLVEHDALVYWRNEQAFPWTLTNAEGETVEPTLKWRLQSDNHEALVDAAVRGMGIVCLPGWLVHEHIKAGRVVPLFERWSSTWLDTYAIWPAAPYMPLRLSVVIETLASRLKAASEVWSSNLSA